MVMQLKIVAVLYLGISDLIIASKTDSDQTCLAPKIKLELEATIVSLTKKNDVLVQKLAAAATNKDPITTPDADLALKYDALRSKCDMLLKENTIEMIALKKKHVTLEADLVHARRPFDLKEWTLAQVEALKAVDWQAKIDRASVETSRGLTSLAHYSMVAGTQAHTVATQVGTQATQMSTQIMTQIMTRGSPYFLKTCAAISTLYHTHCAASLDPYLMHLHPYLLQAQALRRQLMPYVQRFWHEVTTLMNHVRRAAVEQRTWAIHTLSTQTMTPPFFSTYARALVDGLSALCLFPLAALITRWLVRSLLSCLLTLLSVVCCCCCCGGCLRARQGKEKTMANKMGGATSKASVPNTTTKASSKASSKGGKGSMKGRKGSRK